MHRIFAGIVSAAVLLCAPAAAQPSAGVAGIWQGTLGRQQIRACFNQRESSTFGAYYYLNHLVSIPLQQPDDNKPTFVEGGDERDSASSRWTFDKTAPDRLVGTWKQAAR